MDLDKGKDGQVKTLFFLAFILFFIFLASFLVVSHFSHNRILNNLKEESQSTSNQVKEIAKNIIDLHVRYVKFISETPPIQGIAKAEKNNGFDVEGNVTQSFWFEKLENIFVSFMKANHNVTQVRYISANNDGRELVRVQRDNGAISTVENKNLQLKGVHDYFKESVLLKPGGVYISPINLNREYGQIVFPYSATYRISVPVYNDGELFGIVILNFDAEYLFERLKIPVSNNYELYVFNEDRGLVLAPGYEYAVFDLDDKLNENSIFNTETKMHIANNFNSVDMLNRDLFYYYENSLDFPSLGSDYILYVGFKGDYFNSLVKNELDSIVFNGVLLFLLIMLGAYLYTTNVKRLYAITRVNSLYQAIVKSSSEGIMCLDENFNVISCNDAALLILGLREYETLGSAFVDIIQTKEHDIIQQSFSEVLSGKKIKPLRIECISGQFDRMVVLLSMAPVYENNKKISALTIIIQDVTALVLYEDKVNNMNKELEARVSERTFELEVAKNDAVSANKLKSQFIANVSHEIRTPINGITGMLRMLKKNDILEDRKSYYIGLAEKSVGHLLTLINSVLDLSKLESGKMETICEYFDLTALASDVVRSIGINASNKSIDIILDVAEVDHPRLVGDALRIQQILINLLGNAVKFTDNGYVILKLKTNCDNAEVKIFGSVEDTGQGISPDKINTIFDSFSQEDASVNRKYGGTGLGLTITRELCKLMGGEIKVQSTKNEGTQFSFSLICSVDSDKGHPLTNVCLQECKICVIDSLLPRKNALIKQLLVWGGNIVTPDQQDSADLSICNAQDFNGENPALPLLLIDDANSDTASFVREDVSIINVPITPYDLLYKINMLLKLGLKLEKPSLKYLQSNLISYTEIEDGMEVSILIVDDNEINTEVAIGALERKGVSILTASNGQEALDVLATSSIDLVFMDCQMPKLNGYETTRRIRGGMAGKHNQTVPIIAMTASAMAGDKERCISAGMNVSAHSKQSRAA